MPLAIRCRGLVKTYTAKPPVEAVRGLDLEVHSGECFGLLGPNGAGKTTTIEVLEGILEPSSGDVEVLGLRWKKDERKLRQRIGVTLQETKFADKLTVEETLRLFRSFFSRGREVERVVAMVGLEEKRRSRVGKLSGGQKQRLALACALVGDPEILFLDEPTTGLDPQARHKVWAIVEEFRAAGGTVLLTTHYMEEAERLSDRVAVMDHGRVIALGTPAELIGSLGADQILEFRPAGDPPDAETLARLPGVRTVDRKDGSFLLAVTEIGDALPALLAELGSRGIRIEALATRQATLEDVFVHLTGRDLRDA